MTAPMEHDDGTKAPPGISLVLEAYDEVSRAVEFHRRALADVGE
jgi:hypothetical protein